MGEYDAVVLSDGGEQSWRRRELNRGDVILHNITTIVTQNIIAYPIALARHARMASKSGERKALRPDQQAYVTHVTSSGIAISPEIRVGPVG